MTRVKRIKDLVDKTTLKFLIVGVVNTLVGTTIMFGCYNVIGLSYWLSSAANYILTSILSFFLNKYFTFQNKERSLLQIAKFVINIATCYLIAYGIAKPLVLLIFSGAAKRVQENMAMFVGMCLFTGLNYLGQRFFTFRSKN